MRPANAKLVHHLYDIIRHFAERISLSPPPPPRAAMPTEVEEQDVMRFPEFLDLLEPDGRTAARPVDERHPRMIVPFDVGLVVEHGDLPFNTVAINLSMFLNTFH